jgi:hypothetical protein
MRRSLLALLREHHIGGSVISVLVLRRSAGKTQTQLAS